MPSRETRFGSGDPVFGRAILSFVSEKHVLKVFRRFPFLSTDRGVWLAIIDSHIEHDDLPDLIHDHAPEEIRLDKELMILTCKNDGRVLERLNQQLQEDRIVVEAASEGCDFVLMWIPAQTQRLYPALVADAISHCKFVGQFKEYVAEDLWTSLDVATAWSRLLGKSITNFRSQRRMKNSAFSLQSIAGWRNLKARFWSSSKRQGIHDSGRRRVQYDLLVRVWWSEAGFRLGHCGFWRLVGTLARALRTRK
jgi:hypothetical protein